MVMPFATALSRATVTSWPELSLPSPDTSMIRRLAAMPPASSCATAKSILAPIAVRPAKDRGAIEQDLGEFGDGPMRARLNGLHELGICHGCSIASALKLEFLIVDTARYIRRERDCDVDRLRARHRR